WQPHRHPAPIFAGGGLREGVRQSEVRAPCGRHEQLKAAIDYLRDGGVLVATKLERLARSMRHLIQIVDQLEAKGAGLHRRDELGHHLRNRHSGTLSSWRSR